ncbi:unnamed protein product [Durusdinium trenchii]|uniref:Uncharacterized protein n=1 Tax=Durusdinium trenchii TaxID=1381693 RepID=A0ABP0JER5_9DINO
MADTYERLADYFEGLAQPQLQKSLHYFLQNTSPDGEWSVLQEGARVLAQNKEGMQKIIQEPATFVMDILTVFGISAVCKICPGQDSRTTYAGHVCGKSHWGSVYRTQQEAGSAMENQKDRFCQHWIFVLGELMINYLTGELRAKRSPCHLGLRIGHCWELPEPEVWYCVGTEAAVRMLPETEAAPEHWTNAWPTTCGGKLHWKTMMKKPAERLNELLQNHGIQDHCCPICETHHSLWVNNLTGPKHYTNLQQGDVYGDKLQSSPLRFQTWDLPMPNAFCQIVGRLCFDHLSGAIFMVRCHKGLRQRPNDFPTAPKVWVTPDLVREAPTSVAMGSQHVPDQQTQQTPQMPQPQMPQMPNGQAQQMFQQHVPQQMPQQQQQMPQMPNQQVPQMFQQHVPQQMPQQQQQQQQQQQMLPPQMPQQMFQQSAAQQIPQPHLLHEQVPQTPPAHMPDQQPHMMFQQQAAQQIPQPQLLHEQVPQTPPAHMPDQQPHMMFQQQTPRAHMPDQQPQQMFQQYAAQQSPQPRMLHEQMPQTPQTPPAHMPDQQTQQMFQQYTAQQSPQPRMLHEQMPQTPQTPPAHMPDLQPQQMFPQQAAQQSPQPQMLHEQMPRTPQAHKPHMPDQQPQQMFPQHVPQQIPQQETQPQQQLHYQQHLQHQQEMQDQQHPPMQQMQDLRRPRSPQFNKMRPPPVAQDRIETILGLGREAVPGSLFEEFVNPETGATWWWDLVTGEAHHQMPPAASRFICCSPSL